MDISKDVWMGAVQQEVARQLKQLQGGGLTGENPIQYLSYPDPIPTDAAIVILNPAMGTTFTLPDASDSTVIHISVPKDVNGTQVIIPTSPQFGTTQVSLEENEWAKFAWCTTENEWRLLETSGTIA